MQFVYNNSVKQYLLENKVMVKKCWNIKIIVHGSPTFKFILVKQTHRLFGNVQLFFKDLSLNIGVTKTITFALSMF